MGGELANALTWPLQCCSTLHMHKCVLHSQAHLNIEEVASRAAESALNKAEAAFHGACGFMLMCAALILIRLTA